MIPIENPFIKPRPEWEMRAKEEIQSFIDHPTKCAELEPMKGVATQTAKERYKKIIRLMERESGIKPIIIRTKGKSIIAMKIC